MIKTLVSSGINRGTSGGLKNPPLQQGCQFVGQFLSVWQTDAVVFLFYKEKTSYTIYVFIGKFSFLTPPINFPIYTTAGKDDRMPSL